eukprot:1187790-Prorocentrum_minimum.AAC.1
MIAGQRGLSRGSARSWAVATFPSLASDSAERGGGGGADGAQWGQLEEVLIRIKQQLEAQADPKLVRRARFVHFRTLAGASAHFWTLPNAPHTFGHSRAHRRWIQL